MKKTLAIVVAGIIVVLGLILTPQIFDTVEKGTYQIKQAAISGAMTAKMTPGLWWQNFGDISVWPKAETFFFTKDVEEGGAKDQSIEVRFNDGSTCDISGTLRIVLPISPDEAIGIVVEKGYKTYRDAEQKLILPTVRNCLRLTANLMSARESYSEKRTDYIFWASDQIQNGLYKTEGKTTQVKDMISGEMVSKTFKVIKRDETGVPMYQRNPLSGTGIRLANFEVKIFEYAPKVQEQISTQQEAIMAVATAKANAQKAEQDKLTIKAQGLAKVATARYEKEQEKVKAVVDAQKEKEVQELAALRDKQVAITLAEKRKETAKLDKDAAAFKKQEQILLGEGEATRKELVLAADGALAQKLNTYESVMNLWADAYSKRRVPSVMMGGGKGGVDTDALSMSEVLSLMAMKQLGLDFSIPKGAASTSQ